MAEAKKHNYDESKIKTLSSLEHIRLRTGMYIGRVGDGSHYDDGCYILLKEVIDNAVDEYIMGYGKEVHITIDGNAVTVRDFGRGIQPTGARGRGRILGAQARRPYRRRSHDGSASFRLEERAVAADRRPGACHGGAAAPER